MRISSRGIITVISCIFLLGACSSGIEEQGHTNSQAVAGSGVHADIDEAASIVIFPSDRFRLSEQERGIIDTAFTTASNKCVQEKLGLSYRFADMRLTPEQSEIYSMFYEYGPWTTDMASRFGYVAPQTEADMRVNGVEREEATAQSEPEAKEADYLSDEDYERIETECSNIPEAKKFNSGKLENLEPAGLIGPADIESKLKKDERFKGIFEDLKQCYTKNGIAFKESPDATSPSLVEITGSDADALNEEQIQLALKDVACKTEIDMIPRIADLWAEYEAPSIKENAAELQAYREKIDAAVAEAEAYIAENSQYVGK